MAKFLTGNDLNAEIGNIFKSAENNLLLVSPFIKLHERNKSTLMTKLENPGLEVVVIFGKNEDDLSKSISFDDLMFFKHFPNIEIRYEKNLHAKYYANEYAGILCSMNLYSYSQNNNIEAGVLWKPKSSFLASTEQADKEAWKYFNEVVREQSELLFQKSPEYQKTGIFGQGQKYISSKVVIDKTADFFKVNSSSESTKKDSINYNTRVPYNQTHNSPTGYCIRTGKSIPFNPEKPFTKEAWESWVQFNNPDYKEKFCHFSGEPSNGETCYSKPIMHKNWNKAREIFGF